MNVSGSWKTRIVEADAGDAVKVANSDRIMPPYSRPVAPTSPRSLSTSLVETLASAPDRIDAAATGLAFMESLLAGGGDEFLPFAGQSVGLIHDVVSAAEIVARTMEQAETALGNAFRHATVAGVGRSNVS
jgi:nitronate monooxygenase/enoyl-[acyl-carrier protein] reductase II